MVSNQPVVATIDASSESFQLYSGQGPFTGACSQDPQDATHSVLVVGYYTAPAGSSASSYWILKNSWGPNWGDKGYFYLAMGTLQEPLNSCGILNFLSYPVLDSGEWIVLGTMLAPSELQLYSCMFGHDACQASFLQFFK